MSQGVEKVDKQGASRAARPVERVRGAYDQLPDDIVRMRALIDTLSRHATAYGYRPIDTPILEHTELFLRKSGGDRVAQLYAFEHRGRYLALRPEFTAPAVRVFIDHLQSEPLPVRLMYSGPVFRYEKPQAGRSRQFTEFGCELIGVAGPAADAEIIGLAIEGLRRAGVERPQLVIGHIGVVIDFLAGLNIDQRAQDWLTWSMERLRKGDQGAHELPPHLQRLSEPEYSGDDLLGVDDDVSPENIARVLQQAGVQFHGGSRTPEEIVRGLFAKRRRRHDVRILRDAADFVTRLTELAGPPRDVLKPLRDLVASRGLQQTQLDELEQVVELLGAIGYDDANIRIDLGMGRGLHYYTGILFEIYAGSLNGPQLCGGGRYDDLAQVLGARQAVPACGFSYGLERVLAADGFTIEPDAPPVILVLQDDDPNVAMRLAGQFREAGWVASVDLRSRNRSATRRAALRQGVTALASATERGLEVTRLEDNQSMTFDTAPAPHQVIGR